MEIKKQLPALELVTTIVVRGLQLRINFWGLVILFAAIVLLHFIANEVGLYDTSVIWFDNLLHALVGFGFGMLWLGILHRKQISQSYVTILVSTILFVFCLAVIWEFLEFGFFKVFTDYAYELKIYSPSIDEAALDIGSNLLGVLLIPFTWIVHHFGTIIRKGVG